MTTHEPLHSSVRTSTSLNAHPGAAQVLTVTTSRLVIALRDGEVVMQFTMKQERTALRGPAATKASPRRRRPECPQEMR